MGEIRLFKVLRRGNTKQNFKVSNYYFISKYNFYSVIIMYTKIKI